MTIQTVANVLLLSLAHPGLWELNDVFTITHDKEVLRSLITYRNLNIIMDFRSF